MPIAQQIQPPETRGTEESPGSFRRRRRYTRGGVGAVARQRDERVSARTELGRVGRAPPDEGDGWTDADGLAVASSDSPFSPIRACKLATASLSTAA